MKRLVLFVEGSGDVEAAPILANRLLNELPAEQQGVVFVDSKPFELGGVHQLTGKCESSWTKKLEIAKKRPNLGGVLLLLDGDQRKVEGTEFCAARVARILAERAKSTGAGIIFSVAVVFLRQEYESMLVAAYSSLTGHREKVAIPPKPEEAPRDAKGWLSDHLEGGYRETRNQAPLTRELDFAINRSRGFKSFGRLEHAMQELVVAIRTGIHISSPTP